MKSHWANFCRDSVTRALGRCPRVAFLLGAQRARDARDRVARGDQVVVYPSRTLEGEAAYVLAREAGIVAAYKPARMATIANHRGSTGTLEHEVGRLLGVHGLHPTSRLDVGVSGVVLFAEGDEARVHLARMRELGRYARHYVALCRGVPEPRWGTWSFPIGRDRNPRKRRVGGRDATHAETSFAVVATAPGAALLAVEPQTGRTHQIRVHASHVGAPLLGDAAYGGPTRIVTPVARFCRSRASLCMPRGSWYRASTRASFSARTPPFRPTCSHFGRPPGATLWPGIARSSRSPVRISGLC